MKSNKQHTDVSQAEITSKHKWNETNTNNSIDFFAEHWNPCS